MPEHAEPDADPDGADRDGGSAGGSEDRPLGPDERALLDAFDRRSPQGGLQWGFDDAMRRIEHPDIDSRGGSHPLEGAPRRPVGPWAHGPDRPAVRG